MFEAECPAAMASSVAEAALKAAGLAREAPESCVQVLRSIRRIAEAAVQRDLAGPGFGEQTAFPTVNKRIELLEPGEAAQLRLARFRALTPVTEQTRTGKMSSR